LCPEIKNKPLIKPTNYHVIVQEGTREKKSLTKNHYWNRLAKKEIGQNQNLHLVTKIRIATISN
jgi:hypothetical protein